ncbi:MAG: adenylate/guanylate cyclase domain-containing protein [Desertifilum sp. SIO1I2]|nr:adenylate/guanylate cyclase domain-containing protein [Desertifilum sp. SIO1I2]
MHNFWRWFSAKGASTRSQYPGIPLTPWQAGVLLTGLWASLGAIATIQDRPVQLLERNLQVVFFQLRGPVAPPEEMIILAIDRESLARGEDVDPQAEPELAPLQTWPWERRAYATIIDRLMQAGAKAVALDLVFDLPSGYGPQDDRALQAILQKYPGKVAIAALYEDTVTPEGQLTQLLKPLPELATPTTPVGFINYIPAADHRIRTLARTYTQQLSDLVGVEALPSFAEAALSAAGVVYPEPRGTEIYFYGPNQTFPTIPIVRVLEADNWEGYLQQGRVFENKIVLIGPTAPFFKDEHRTPFSQTALHPAPMTGIEIHANSVATLLEGRSLRPLFADAWGRGIFVFILVVAASSLVRLVPQRPLWQLLSGFGVAIAWAGCSYLLFTYAGLILPAAIPMGAIALSSVSYFTAIAIGDRLEKQKVRHALERYVAAPIVNEILKQPQQYQALLKGRRIQAAVLFSDIRDFTTLSTQLEPEELVEQLNTYLDAMVEAILSAGGTVDKFIGDAIMAEFGSPVSQGPQQDALNAVKAALGMRQNLMRLRKLWQQQGKKQLFNGIGINYGELIAGDIGSLRRREYAVIGDTVNVASRVEGLTKNFGTDILITEPLYQLIADEIEVIDLGEQWVKGRATAVRIYSVVALKGQDTHLYQQVREDFHEYYYPTEI